MNDLPEIVIYGASGHANAYRCFLAEHRLADVVAFIDDYDGDRGHLVADRLVISLQTWRAKFPLHSCLIAVANPAAKRRIAERVETAGGAFYCPHESPAHCFVDVSIGPGTLIARPVYVGPNSRVGAHVTIMPMSTIGHDVEVGDFCTICPGANVGGQVVIESEVFVGSGAVILNGMVDRPLIIGRGATVAAGAVVTKAVAAGTTVMGNPARPMRELARNERNAPSARVPADVRIPG
jgi:sugar O-acyltransferase (sialic acid O-acetyltransferase NeuD family)